MATTGRYAKNSSGRMGVIPENYVQALADPPEPNEPPPAMSTFSHTSNNYPNLDAFGNNNNTAKSSYSPPAYDQHQYMNPGTHTNNWQTQEISPWALAPPLPPQLTNVRHIFLRTDLYLCPTHRLPLLF